MKPQLKFKSFQELAEFPKSIDVKEIDGVRCIVTETMDGQKHINAMGFGLQCDLEQFERLADY
jgi:hypothetical protein